MEKAFSGGKTGKWPEKRRTGKRANEIECPEKGKGKAPNLKSRAREENIGANRSTPVAANPIVILCNTKTKQEMDHALEEVLI